MQLKCQQDGSDGFSYHLHPLDRHQVPFARVFIMNASLECDCYCWLAVFTKSHSRMKGVVLHERHGLDKRRDNSLMPFCFNIHQSILMPHGLRTCRVKVMGPNAHVTKHMILHIPPVRPNEVYWGFSRRSKDIKGSPFNKLLENVIPSFPSFLFFKGLCSAAAALCVCCTLNVIVD